MLVKMERSYGSSINECFPCQIYRHSSITGLLATKCLKCGAPDTVVQYPSKDKTQNFSDTYTDVYRGVRAPRKLNLSYTTRTGKNKFNNAPNYIYAIRITSAYYLFIYNLHGETHFDV